MFSEIGRIAFYILFGLCGGGLVAAGLFAFITILGLVPRLAARTHTASQIHRYENWIVAGALFGNLLNLHQVPFYQIGQRLGQRLSQVLGTPLFGDWEQGLSVVSLAVSLVMGLASGIFVGCLVMSLAETLDALPTMSRRIHLSVGIQYIIEALAIGKLVGSLIYFYFQISL